MRRVAKALAEHGYTACSINYRLAPQHPFPAQIDDCKTAVRWLRRMPPSSRWILTGWVAMAIRPAANLVALLGVTDRDDGLEGARRTADGPSTRLQCVVAGGAPCDFRSMPADKPALAYWLGEAGRKSRWLISRLRR